MGYRGSRGSDAIVRAGLLAWRLHLGFYFSPPFILFGELRLVLAAEGIKLSFPYTFDFRFVDLLLLGDIVAMSRFGAILSLRCSQSVSRDVIKITAA